MITALVIDDIADTFGTALKGFEALKEFGINKSAFWLRLAKFEGRRRKLLFPYSYNGVAAETDVVGKEKKQLYNFYNQKVS